MGSSGRDPVKGYMTYLGMHMVICYGPVDAVTEIVIDRKSAWSGSESSGEIYINKTSLFGGYDKEGGILGYVDILSGAATQGQNAYLVDRLGSDVPTFRKILSLVLKQPYVGMSTYLKAWAARVQRIHVKSNDEVQWYDAKAAIDDDMNPAHIIRECLTDKTWGMGYSESDIDATSFEAAADTLYTEGMGMSMVWDSGIRLGKFINEIKSHINASLYISRTTGKFVLKLIRDDYDIETITELSESEILKVSNFSRLAVADLTSEVTVVYNNAENNEKKTVTARNLALANQQGSAVGISVPFKGFTKDAVAAQIAARELKGRSMPLASITIDVTQAANELNNGDPFIFSYSPYGISNMVMRVTTIKFGTLAKNTITINAVEDVFGTGDTHYDTPPTSLWDPLDADPVKVAHSILIESPYFDIVMQIGDNDAQALDATTGFFGVTAVQPIGAVINADLWVDRGAGYVKPGGILPVNLCPSALLTANLSKTATSITFDGGEDMPQVIDGTYLILNDEIMLISSSSVVSTTGTLTVVRGCGDTVPATHTDDDRFFCCEKYFQTDRYIYADAESINVKLATRTNTALLDIAAADADNLVFDSRQTRPYPPGQFKINGDYFPADVSGDVVVTWAARNRLTQSAALIGFVENAIAAEVGTTYTCVLKNGDTDAVIDTQTGITLSTVTFTEATVGAPTRIKVELWAVRDGYASWQIHTNISTYGLYIFEDGDSYEFEDGSDYEFNEG